VLAHGLGLNLACGLAFGAVAVGLMLPLEFPDRRTALAAAFASRFAIGFLVPAVHLPVPMAIAGAIVGLLVSLPDAIVTKAYVPILAIGTAGGALIGWIAGALLA
jgi:hypothetical protein